MAEETPNESCNEPIRMRISRKRAATELTPGTPAATENIAPEPDAATEFGQIGDVAIVAYATEPGVDPLMLLQPRDAQWEIHVKVNHNMWWEMPHALSDEILENWRSGAQQVSCIWDYIDDDEEAPINRYIINFATMQMCNQCCGDTRIRAVKIVNVKATE